MTIIESQPLNPLQRAYLMGRNSQVPLGGVAMHDFREFRCNFTGPELEKAVHQLAHKHPFMRTLIDEDDLTKKVMAEVVLNVEIIDMRDREPQIAQQEVSSLRANYSHEVLSLNQPLWSMRLILMPEQTNSDGKSSALFTSFDGLIVDGYAIAVLLSELFNGESIHQSVSQRQMPAGYFANKPVDQAYWEDKLGQVDNITTLPWKRDLETIFSPNYQRQGIVIPRRVWQLISALGAKYQLLPNSVLTTALFEVVALWAHEHYLLLSMPISNSILYPELSNRSSFIALEYQAKTNKDFVEKARSLQKDVLEAMAHTTFSGVELGKMLVKKTAKISNFTSGGNQWTQLGVRRIRKG